jgi:hypothetical protein
MRLDSSSVQPDSWHLLVSKFDRGGGNDQMTISSFGVGMSELQTRHYQNVVEVFYSN